jgi:hypothetical protein
MQRDSVVTLPHALQRGIPFLEPGRRAPQGIPCFARDDTLPHACKMQRDSVVTLPRALQRAILILRDYGFDASSSSA